MNSVDIKVCAGIVLYNPVLKDLKQNIESIYSDVEEIILVDNGSNNVQEISELNKNMNKVHLIINDSNLGIAKALNQMCSYAYERSYEWILTLDHDTNCGDAFIFGLLKYANLDNVGIVCPAVNYLGTNKKIISNNEIDEVNACMTSGSLTNIKAWKRIGGFSEEYFIDFVDNDYCMKLSVNNFKIIRSNTSVMNHQLGEPSTIIFFGIFHINAVRHSPLRLYYMTRNNLYYIKMYKKYLNVPKEIIKFVYVIGKEFLFSENKKESFKYIKRGYDDEKNGKTGRY